MLQGVFSELVCLRAAPIEKFAHSSKDGPRGIGMCIEFSIYRHVSEAESFF